MAEAKGVDWTRLRTLLSTPPEDLPKVKDIDWTGLEKLVADIPPSLWRNVAGALTYGGLMFTVYGFLLGVWSYFELVVEVLLKKELDLDNQETSIVCGGLGFANKLNILCSLLSRADSNAGGVALLRRTHALAERNSFAHGFIGGEIPTTALFTRDVKQEYTVRSKKLDIVSMLRHTFEFGDKVMEVVSHFNLTPELITDYLNSISNDAKAHETRAQRQRQPQTNVRLTKRQARAERVASSRRPKP